MNTGLLSDIISVLTKAFGLQLVECNSIDVYLGVYFVDAVLKIEPLYNFNLSLLLRAKVFQTKVR